MLLPPIAQNQRPPKIRMREVPHSLMQQSRLPAVVCETLLTVSLYTGQQWQSPFAQESLLRTLFLASAHSSHHMSQGK